MHFFISRVISTTVLSRSSLFCNVTRCRLSVGYGRFGTTYRSHIQESNSSIIMATTGGFFIRSETNVGDSDFQRKQTSQLGSWGVHLPLGLGKKNEKSSGRMEEARLLELSRWNIYDVTKCQ